jgi:hypothetical protein
MKGLKKMERELMGRHGDIADCGLKDAEWGLEISDCRFQILD